MKLFIATIIAAMLCVCPAVAQAGTHSATLSWTAGSGGGVATNYNVYQSTATGGCATVNPLPSTCQKIATVPAPNLTVNVTGLNGSTTYFWVLTASNATGESGTSNQASATTPPDAPVAPTNLSISGVK